VRAGRWRPDLETRIFAVGVREKGTLEREASAGRAPYIEPLRPWLDVAAGRGAKTASTSPHATTNLGVMGIVSTRHLEVFKGFSVHLNAPC
jgi:hypothetical protein